MNNIGSEAPRGLHEELIDTISQSVISGDTEFALELAREQTALRPFKLAEYMNLCRRASEDPVQADLWRHTLKTFLEQTPIAEFSGEEIGPLRAIFADLESDNTTSGAEQENERGFLTETFEIPLPSDEIRKISHSPVFQRAVAAIDECGELPFEQARMIIYDAVEGDEKEKMLKVFDRFVFALAHKHATLWRTAQMLPFDKSHEVIEEHASDIETAQKMRSALDKHVYHLAEAHLQGREGSAFPEMMAEEIIRDYASTEARRDMMLRRLGFM